MAPRNESKQREQIIADLIIDATGRGSATSAWLEKLGFERPWQTTPKCYLRRLPKVVKRVCSMG